MVPAAAYRLKTHLLGLSLHLASQGLGEAPELLRTLLRGVPQPDGPCESPDRTG